MSEKKVSFNFVIEECYREAYAAQENMINYKDMKKYFSMLYHCWTILAHHFEAISRDRTFKEEAKGK